jgi:hypothetical protein
MPPGQGYIVVMPDGQSIPVQSIEEIPPEVMQMIQSGQAQITDPQGNPVDPSQIAGGGGPPGGPGGPMPPGGPGGMQGPGGMPPGLMQMVAALGQGQQQGNIQAPSMGPMQGPANGGLPVPSVGGGPVDPLMAAMQGGVQPPHPSTMPPNLMQERLMPPGGPQGGPPMA